MERDFGGGDDIRFEIAGRAGIVTLTRPKALNAVNHRMVLALHRALDAWAADAEVALVVIRAEGRAFSAGGDILDIYEAGRAGNPPVGFFADEYRLNAAIARFPKPYVALVDGIVMGGGVGVSFHGSHRVMTENAVFAMPEVGIGFFPDVGGSRLLAELPRSFGMYLGLTGQRIRRGDALWAGLATHAVDAGNLPALLAALCESGDPAAPLRDFCVDEPRGIDEAALHAIAHCFSRDRLEDVVASLRLLADDGDDFARATLDTLAARSPTSLNVAFRQIGAGAMLSMDECMRMEFRILNRMLAGHDFYEGIRAAIIDKGSQPAWRPATLEAVDAADIEAYFAPLPGGDLEL
ncbi:enoyl-CoA hydratase/isomerase family protein [Aquibium sp. A9E412]|uniref:enoyl-CoA hydratase/isomerase family protein n=1 Tax=Aquibium sp. A9E412 TaxID=2976767 RepID=UPI0025AF92B1|nr:enoyl-CoA hydratase/isomerase family protein [Aquibium sp. A9E412]MDN2564963.1 enoyl-CoA hydratase/isomerase family protein [Aquibium sp. A9E412]